jgi:hypothetical protein
VKLRHVILLEEAVEDLEIGREFYDDQDEGVGAYFVTSLLSDIASLNLIPEFIPSTLDFIVCCRNVFPSPSIMSSSRREAV